MTMKVEFTVIKTITRLYSYIDTRKEKMSEIFSKRMEIFLVYHKWSVM